MKQLYCPTLPEKTQQKLKTWYITTCYISVGTIILLIGATLLLIKHKKECTAQRTLIVQKTQTTPLPAHLLKHLESARPHALSVGPALLLHLISTTQPPHSTVTHITATPTSWDIEGHADTKDTVHLFIKELSKGLRTHAQQATCSLKKLTSLNESLFFILHLDI